MNGIHEVTGSTPVWSTNSLASLGRWRPIRSAGRTAQLLAERAGPTPVWFHQTFILGSDLPQVAESRYSGWNRWCRSSEAWTHRPTARAERSLAQQLANRGIAVPLGPRHRPCPLRGICLHRIGAALEKQRHQLRALPPAGPAKRRALEQVITHV